MHPCCKPARKSVVGRKIVSSKSSRPSPRKPAASRSRGERSSLPLDTIDELPITELPVDEHVGGEVDDDFEDDHEEPEVEAEAVEDLADLEGDTGSGDRIDDPIRIYLMQMGEIPLLTRPGRGLGRQADRIHPHPLSRQHAGQRLRAAGRDDAVEEGARRRAAVGPHVEVSVTDATEKKAILSLLGPNLATLDHLLRQNVADFRVAISKSRPKRSGAMPGAG